MKVYVCSRVSQDARPLNKRVADSLAKAGFEVYLPQDQKPNNPENGRYNKEEIWTHDYAAMRASSLCVVVGRVGKDCSWEIGWFYRAGSPIFFVPAGDTTYLESPMLIPALTEAKQIENPDTAGEEIKKAIGNVLLIPR